ncbi:ligase-associated DNA damage response exonuclease [Nannocystaceae bacterium ST9]
MTTDLLIATDLGLACPRGGFVIDPRRAVELALLTHGHADHARRGSARYVATRTSLPLLRHRLAGAEIEGLAYGERRRFGDVTVSMHPAGHMLGSAQIRIEAEVAGKPEVWVVTGDFKRASDPSCTEFEPLRCDVLVSEATFALPIYRWRPTGEVIDEIVAWWRRNADEGRCALLCCYAAGKAQRILVELARRPEVELDRIFVHGAIEPGNAAYRESGVAVPPVLGVTGLAKRFDFSKALVLAPPAALRSVWSRRLGEFEAAFASGWTRLRGYRRRYGYARGFELSDHADWPALLQTVRESGAREVRVTHGYASELARWLSEQGLRASVFESLAAARAGGEEDGGDEAGGDEGASE